MEMKDLIVLSYGSANITVPDLPLKFMRVYTERLEQMFKWILLP